ncbi:hypothetical protein BS47DRAFT_1489056 [Hydnum rufescens UP504]|uniref:GmrSD restriction endonucleases N-terminal domain-containing protein n=1 Tax=Hydnum rufescens UP504 TaxID=1448309 RepID=A0A9P6AJQ9_9AGAM|nr:hypothetical protein BS47DRAFT_1489056 [Hydnum rufescens UP504]
MPSPNNKTHDEELDELFGEDLDDTDEDVELTLEGELKEPRSTSYSAWNLYEMMLDNGIDLDPEVHMLSPSSVISSLSQTRLDVVWPPAAQSKIIESWMKRFHVPPILFRFVEEGAGERRICIDGKQRLTSLRRFFNGEVPYIDETTQKRFYFKINAVEANTRKKKPALLPPKLIMRIKNKQIRCEEYSDITEEQERALFQRVQKGMALSPAEKLQSSGGPWHKFIKEIQTWLSRSESRLLEVINLNLSRGASYGNLARLVYLIHNVSSQNSRPRPPGEGLLKEWLDKSTEPTRQFQDRVHHVVRVYEGLATDDGHCKTAFCSAFDLDPDRFSSKHRLKYSPVEFVLTGLLIALHPHLHMYKLAKAIRDFRTALYGQYAMERKFNQKVFDLFWEVEGKLGDEGKDRMGEKRKYGEIVSDSEVEDGEEYEPPLGLEHGGSTDRQTRATNAAPPPPKLSRLSSSSQASSSRNVVTPIKEFKISVWLAPQYLVSLLVH